MTNKDIKKIAALVKSSTQREAVAAVLQAGFEPSVADFQAAGIADPRRVVNALRTEHGAPIYLNNRYEKDGTLTRRFRLGSPKKVS